MSQMYQSLAAVYDQIQDTDFTAWADYIGRLEERYGQRNGQGDGRQGRPILLDLGCGTGGFCLEMAGRGYDPVGIDASSAMLSAARDKMAERFGPTDDPPCLFLQQDISRFELYGTVDLIVCLMDTVNHLMRRDQVRRLFKLCGHYLNPGGIMVFDLASWNLLAQTRGQNVFYVDLPDGTLIWQNHFSTKKKQSEAELTLFIPGTDGLYRRAEEKICERFYDTADIQEWIQGTGLEWIAGLGHLSLRRPHTSDERTFCVLRQSMSHAQPAS